jgi:hypothetical protein
MMPGFTQRKLVKTIYYSKELYVIGLKPLKTDLVRIIVFA